ncbi:SPOR domain-containing protein [Marinomonas pollencensis]|uniref:DedD protein n=1 Tax=Marinomonas pollencensis TaxID=491954 RepID=A0A3E0DNC4_9GAMM|nr:SPOR domain-containing protein [Marinomonas pollencensis]REG83301.1 DedD protein [Marinomonas pollencensis]
MLDKKMTHRLIGASILIVAAAIILPQILDGERPPELDVQVVVSKPPVFPEVKIAPAQSLDKLPDATEDSSVEPSAEEIQLTGKSAQDISLVAEADKEPPAPVVQAKPKVVVKQKEAKPPVVSARWTVQIATFAQEANAKRLVSKLKKANYPAYSITTNALFKVYVGPELDRTTSEKVQADIHKKFSLKGIVVKFSEN